MRRGRLFWAKTRGLCFVILVAFNGIVHAKEPHVSYGTLPEVLTMFTKVYRPLYSYEELSRRMHGTGIFRMYINEDGVVTKIGVMKSTGHFMLDRDASNALIHWKAKPGRRREVDMPVTFSLN